MHEHLKNSEIVIIGAGLAGLFTALKLAPRPVTVISALPLGEGAASTWAQGGIAAAIGEGDTPEAHAADTITAGDGLVDPAIALSVAREASDRINDLLQYGVPFDRELEGVLALSREAAHSKNRIVRVKGDMAGQAIMSALITAAKNEPSITILENFEARKILTNEGRVTGVQLADLNAPHISRTIELAARAVVLAAGGIGQLYEVTTNPGTARGDAVAMAARAGAIIADAEFVQFHPTAINIGKDPAPLATEALRGEGATLVNSTGERFMKKVHDDAELAPRDIVARSVHREIKQGRGAFLDCRTAIGRKFADKFPTVFKICMDAGIDPTRELIPVAPAAHYHMGGILTDAIGRSSLNGLWACGEAASTGLHGANRLASNSLLEAVVFAARIADDLNGLLLNRVPSQFDAPRIQETSPIEESPDEQQIIKSIRKLMTRHVGVVRTGDGLEEALDTFESYDHISNKSARLENMLTAAKTVTTAALARTESRGGHFRTDHPQPKEEFRKRSFLTKDDIDQQHNSARPEYRKGHLTLVSSS